MDHYIRPSRPLHSRGKRTPLVSELAQAYLYWAKNSLKASSYESYAASLRVFTAWADQLSADDLTDLTIQRYMRERLDQGKAANTVRGDHRRLSAWMEWAVERGHLPRNWAKLAKPPTEPKQLLRSIEEEEHRKLIAYCAGTETEYRDTAILWLLWDTGMRIGEVQSLDFSAVDCDQMTVVVRYETEKTTKERWLHFSETTRDAIYNYLAFERGQKPGPLFVSARGGVALGAGALKHRIAKLAKRAGMEHAPHDYRRAFVERAQANGMPDTMLQALTGHSSTEMLRRYGRRAERENALKAHRKFLDGAG